MPIFRRATFVAFSMAPVVVLLPPRRICVSFPTISRDNFREICCLSPLDEHVTNHIAITLTFAPLTENYFTESGRSMRAESKTINLEFDFFPSYFSPCLISLNPLSVYESKEVSLQLHHLLGLMIGFLKRQENLL